MSVISAFLAKANSLLSSASVTVYFGEANLPTVAPYVTMEDEGTVPEYLMGHSDTVGETGDDGVEVTTIKLSVWAVTLASVDTYVKALKYGTGTPAQAGGLDFGTLGTLGTLGSYLSLMAITRVKEQRMRQHLEYTPDAQICHLCELTYQVQTQITDAP